MCEKERKIRIQLRNKKYEEAKQKEENCRS